MKTKPKKIIRRPWTKTELKELKKYSKARVPVVTVSKPDEADHRLAPRQGLCTRDWPWSSALERKAACVATSGPSLGRKRPRRAAIAGALPHTLPKTIAISGSIERR